MFRGPLLMQQGASLTRALSLFRQMGLHHILIAPPDPRAIGFITRKVTLHEPLDSHMHFPLCLMSRGLLNGRLAEPHPPMNVFCRLSASLLYHLADLLSHPTSKPLSTGPTQCAARHLPECPNMLLQDLAMENARLVRMRKQGSAAEHEAGTSTATGKEQNGCCPGDSSSAV